MTDCKLSYLLLFFILISGAIYLVNYLETTSTSPRIPLDAPVSLFNTWKVIRMPNAKQLFHNGIRSTGGHGSRPFKITFFKENAINLSLSTNDCSLGYRLKESHISFQKNITCTEACCDSGQDEFLIGQLSGTLKYSIQGKTLTINTEAGSIQFALSSI
jgi:hypothetical protein